MATDWPRERAVRATMPPRRRGDPDAERGSLDRRRRARHSARSGEPGDRGRRRQPRRYHERGRAPPERDVIDAGPGYGRACLAATRGGGRTATSSSSWTATAPTIPAASRPWSSRSAPGAFDFVIGSRARGEREAGSIAWHQIAAGMLAGYGMRLLYGVRYTDMCAFRAIRARSAADARHAARLTYGWNIEMQMRAARAGLAHSRNSGAVPLPDRRAVEGGRQSARDNSRRNAHHRHLRPGFGTTGAGTGRLALTGLPGPPGDARRRENGSGAISHGIDAQRGVRRARRGGDCGPASASRSRAVLRRRRWPGRWRRCVGWAVFSVVALPVFTLVGFSATTVRLLMALALAGSLVALWRMPSALRTTGGEPEAGIALPPWAWLGAAVLAIGPALAILPKILRRQRPARAGDLRSFQDRDRRRDDAARAAARQSVLRRGRRCRRGSSTTTCFTSARRCWRC